MARDLRIFWSSFFFVLGFSVIFSLLGVLLQSLLVSVSYAAKTLLAKLGGIIIIFFGIYLTGILKIPFFEREHKFKPKKTNSSYLTSFIFGAAFALGWTPCVGAVLGAILTLAATTPSIAFFLLLSYSLGLGLPFLIMGYFVDEAQRFFVKGGGKYTKYIGLLNKVFGVVLILMGVAVFTNSLGKLANFGGAVELLLSLETGLNLGTTVNLGVAFLAGIISFLSPCILPLMPAFLTYLASIGVNHE
ncbi:MAG: cytochrome C biogenesis protein [Candidatus Altiarchaeota archaeon]|nr:cytochrome C biogenesis protein [Candidatus Altiarchaeota archaeon]